MRPWRARAPSPVLLPGAFYVLREKQLPPVASFRRHGVPMAIATDSNPGTSPITSLLLTLNMAATLFGLTVEETIAGATRKLCAPRQARRHRYARARQMVRPRGLGHRTAGRAGLPHRVQSAPCARAERRMITLTPGRTTLADWRAVCRRRGRTVSIRRLSRRRSSRARGRSRPSLAQRRAGLRDQHRLRSYSRASAYRRGRTSPALQRNIVLSHAAGVGEPMPARAWRG